VTFKEVIKEGKQITQDTIKEVFKDHKLIEKFQEESKTLKINGIPFICHKFIDISVGEMIQTKRTLLYICQKQSEDSYLTYVYESENYKLDLDFGNLLSLLEKIKIFGEHTEFIKDYLTSKLK